MNKLTLNLEDIQTEDGFHDLVINSFDFPHYYGRNRDAFWDCITDFVDPTEVLVLNFDSLKAPLRSMVADYLAMLRDYEVESDGEFSVIFGPTSQTFQQEL